MASTLQLRLHSCCECHRRKGCCASSCPYHVESSTGSPLQCSAKPLLVLPRPRACFSQHSLLLPLMHLAQGKVQHSPRCAEEMCSSQQNQVHDSTAGQERTKGSSRHTQQPSSVAGKGSVGGCDGHTVDGERPAGSLSSDHSRQKQGSGSCSCVQGDVRLHARGGEEGSPQQHGFNVGAKNDQKGGGKGKKRAYWRLRIVLL